MTPKEVKTFDPKLFLIFVFCQLLLVMVYTLTLLITKEATRISESSREGHLYPQFFLHQTVPVLDTTRKRVAS